MTHHESPCDLERRQATLDGCPLAAWPVYPADDEDDDEEEDDEDEDDEEDEDDDEE